jgi:hypothetical protein
MRNVKCNVQTGVLVVVALSASVVLDPQKAYLFSRVLFSGCLFCEPPLCFVQQRIRLLDFIGAKQEYRRLRLYALEDIEENFAGAVCIHDPSVDPLKRISEKSTILA